MEIKLLLLLHTVFKLCLFSCFILSFVCSFFLFSCLVFFFYLFLFISCLFVSHPNLFSIFILFHTISRSNLSFSF
ncbi:hypothetical protein C1645_782513 [Glomus cerebriforme]|uniref:Uncharacterized protein n=1 Tax=Glomus cerebriforme TaxID=658196 RepID=A0A397SM47_9GLOM|nr:hypothetical protein C1645_782513 [Glomus cerebriforme]